MSETLVAALASLQQLSEAHDRIAAIKRSVASAIRMTDPGADLKMTDYFNHAAVPDMIVQWRSKAEPDRELYLRGNSDPRELLQGMEFVASPNAIVMSLQAFSDDTQMSSPDRASANLQAVAKERGAWVVEPSAVDSLASARLARNSSSSLVGQALVRGGSGVTPQARAEHLLDRVDHGFEGAATLDVTATVEAVTTLRDALDVRQSSRMERVLRAVWEGNGGLATDFPAGDSFGALSDDDLLYLLESVSADTLEFWRRIGGTVTAAQIAGLHLADPSANLQLLVSANLERLQIKGFRVVREDVYLGEPDQYPRWRAEGRLSLRGRGWTAYLAPTRADELPSVTEGEAVPLSTVRSNADRGHVRVTQVEFATDARTMKYESNDGSSVLQDAELDDLAAKLRTDRIQSVVFQSRPAGTATADFAKRHVLGQTSATFIAGGLLRTGLPLLLDASAEEWQIVHDFLSGGTESQSHAQLEL